MHFFSLQGETYAISILSAFLANFLFLETLSFSTSSNSGAGGVPFQMNWRRVRGAVENARRMVNEKLC